MNLNQQERFSRLQFPVHKITAKTPAELFEILPGLKRYFQKLEQESIEYQTKKKKQKDDEPDSFFEGKADGYAAKYRGVYPEDLVRIIKYIVFVYDPDTDLINDYPDEPKLLKDAAAKEAGFHRMKDGEWPSYVQDILDFKEKTVVWWIIDYLKVRKNPVWTELKFIEEEIDFLYRKRTNELLKGDINSQTMRLIEERNEKRKSLYERFYAEHSDLKKATQEDLFPVSPENVYKALKIPQEVWKVRQTRDVPTNTGINKESD